MQSFVAKLKGLTGVGSSDGPIKITFSIPTPGVAEALPDLGRLRLGKKDADQNGPLEYLDACRKEARALSRCNLSSTRRLQMTEEFAKHLVQIVAKHILTYSADGGVPDSDRRKDMLDTAAAAIGYLVDAYKVVLKKVYGGSGSIAGSAAKEFELAGFRILELSKVLQRVLGLRYQVLSGPSWLTVNTVIQVLRVCGHAETPIAMLETDLVEDQDTKPQTAVQMFLAVQMVGRFDILRWPTEMQQFIFGYCKSMEYLADVAADDGEPLARNVALSYCYDTRHARVGRAPNPDLLGPALQINWNKLIKKITNDLIIFFSASSREDLNYFQKRLERLSYNECLSLVQLQFDTFTNANQHAAVDSGRGQACDMRIFIGFKSVYQLLHNIHLGKFGVGQRLDDMLAKRSAVFADDHVASAESVWFLQFEDAQLIRLKTQESHFTTAMRIGMMAAYGVGNEGIAKPQFGVVSRLYRPSPQTVIVDIVKHGHYVEPVVVSSDPAAFDKDERGQGLLLGAIEVSGTAGETKLLLPPLSTLREKAELAMKRSKTREKIALGKLQTVTRDFFLFRLA